MKSAYSSFVRVTSRFLRRTGISLVSASNTLEYIRFKHFELTVQESDIFIVSYPRSGTTWMQMILHGLTSDNDTLDFSHISEVVPWLERRLTQAVSQWRPGQRRIFKSHLHYRRTAKTIPKGPARYIYVTRDGRDVALSYYEFYKSHLHFGGSFDEFFNLFMSGKVQFGSWFRHVSDWCSAKGRMSVLYLTYEDLSSDLPGTIRRVASFCNINVSDEQLDRVAARCTFEFMKRHEEKFDHRSEVKLERAMKPGQFIRVGKTGLGREQMNASQSASFERASARWFGKSGPVEIE